MSLCLSCGICCDGALFGCVPIGNADNLAAMEAAAIEVLVLDGQSQFKQPCPAYSCKGCRIYADRPASCREFCCKLLAEYEGGKMSMLVAREKIKQACSLRDSLLETLRRIDPALSGRSLAELWKQWDSAAKGAEGLVFRQKFGYVLMQMAALRRFFDRHFIAQAFPRGDDSEGTRN